MKSLIKLVSSEELTSRNSFNDFQNKILELSEIFVALQLSNHSGRRNKMNAKDFVTQHGF